MLTSNVSKSSKLSDFSTENATEIKLTNDERKQLLTIFSFRRQVYTGIALLIAAFFTSLICIIFCGITKVTESVLGTIICMLPGIILIIAGIYLISTAPNIEESTIKAYEFTVTDIMHTYLVHGSGRGGARYHTDNLTVITHEDAAKYSTYGSTKSRSYHLFLQLDGKWIEVNSAEGFAQIRFGIKIGDKIRCAVLECGKYCYISLY